MPQNRSHKMLLMLEMTFWDLHKLSVVERQKYTQILSS